LIHGCNPQLHFKGHTMKLLHIDSSILAANSVSRQLTAQIVASGNPATPAPCGLPGPGHQRAQPPVGGLAGLSHASRRGRTERRAKRENAISEALVSQFLAADVIVVGAPLYNFSIPSQLKAWIDRVAQVGRTFKYTDKGPQGLAGGKTVIVASTRGGVYSTSEGGRAMEHQESYLQTVFGFLGITDVRFVRAEGAGHGRIAAANEASVVRVA
jgi:FMN-dependent NADH-azoreductase